jgi:hypothetical protein
MKFHKNPPMITITEDDVELVAHKVQDRGEDVVRATKKQRRKGRISWKKWYKFMASYRGYK